jgi:hypothetical protein
MLRKIFTDAEMQFETEPIPTTLNDSPGMMIGGGPPGPATIWVGPKRPPQ